MTERAWQERLGQAIAQRRRVLGMTQEQFAEAVGASTEWVSQVERGVGAPSLEKLVRYADVLQVHPGELLDVLTDAEVGRPAVQRLGALAARLPDWAVDVLVSVAETLTRREDGPSGG